MLTSVSGMPVQTISFAPPEGFMDVDRSDKSSAVAAQPSEGVPSSSADANSGAALQDVAASLANVKNVIRSGAADRYQVIDMLTNLLRETLQVSQHVLTPEAQNTIFLLSPRNHSALLNSSSDSLHSAVNMPAIDSLSRDAQCARYSLSVPKT